MAAAQARSHARFTVIVGLLCAALVLAHAVPAASSAEPAADQPPGSRPADWEEPFAAATTGGSVAPVVVETGRIRAAIDGIGTNDPAGGVVRIHKTIGSTVRRAFLTAASTGFSGYVPSDGEVTIDGQPVNWDPAMTVPNSIGSYNVWTEVTHLVKPKLDAADPGNVPFTIAEGPNTHAIDGEILAVIFDDPLEFTTNTVVLMYGAQNVTGDTITLGRPVDQDDEDLEMTLSLGISYGFQPANQYSIIDVNGRRLTTSAGGQDDGQGQNGALLTVGGFGDSTANPPDPFATDLTCGNAPRCDDELYDLKAMLDDDDEAVVLTTSNPSQDDNIFFAALLLNAQFALVGEGVTLDPPTQVREPGEQAALVATAYDANGDRKAGQQVRAEVVDGPNEGTVVTGTTDASGVVVLGLESSETGTDTVVAAFDGDDVSTPSQPATVVWAGPIAYVALGDSYSSGEGAGDYAAGTDVPSNRCHRSANAYSELFPALRSRESYGFYACSGAKTPDFWRDTQYASEGSPQLQRPLVRSDTDLVTFTIGGNDVGFGPIVTECVVRLDCTSSKYRIPFTDILGSVVGSTFDKIAQMPGTLGDTYLRVRGVTGPDTAIMTANYPHLIPSNWQSIFCPKLAMFHPNERQFIRAATDAMSGAIESAALDAGIHFVDVRGHFAGHEVCGPDGEWLHGISSPKVHSFHPSVAGQAAYAQVFERYTGQLIRRGAPLTPAGLPRNPEPGVALLQAAAATSEIPEGEVPVAFAELALSPASAEPSCVDSYTAGSSVEVTGHGYAPDSPVALTLLAYDREEVDLGIVWSDAGGSVHASVTIPAGYDPVEMAAVDAVGEAADGDILVTVGALEVIDPAHPCAGDGGGEPVYSFSGFFGPVDNPPVVNTVRAGSAVPLIFELGGDHGLDVFAPDSPSSAAVTCDTLAPRSDVDSTATPGASGLTYDQATGRYTYVWKTSKAWTGCRELLLHFADGTTATALFEFR